MKRLLFFLLSFVAVIPTNAQIREYKGDLITQFKRDAFKYREEIRESLKDSLLAHGAAPALHSIWIDRGGFTALNLDGKPFLPGVEYDWISAEISPGVYTVYRRTASMPLCGVVNAFGEIIVPIKYDYIRYSALGLIESFAGQRDWLDPYQFFDVYTMDGTKICTFNNLSNTKDSGNAYYYSDSHAVKVSWGEYHQVFTTQGKPLTQIVKGLYSMVWKEALEVTSKDMGGNYVKTNYPLNGYSLESCPPLNFDKTAAAEAARQSFLSNIWIKKAMACYESGDYKMTLTYLDYYDAFDVVPELILSDRGFVFVSMYLNAEYELGMYDNIYQQVKAQKFVNHYGVGFENDGKMSPSLLSDIKDCPLSYSCQDIYAEIVAPRLIEDQKLAEKARKKAAKEARRIEAAERRRQNAEIWGAALIQAMGTTLEYMQSMPQQQPRPYGGGAVYTAPVSGSSYSGGGSSYSGGSTSPSSAKSVEKHTKCQVCGGTGLCKVCGGSGKRVYGGKSQRCAACDGHPKCRACDGRGYKISY